VKGSVLSFEEKTTQPWFTFKLPASTKNSLRPARKMLFFDDFSIWL